MSESNPAIVPDSFGALVLCGGSSTRMGQDKAFAPFHGSPLVLRPLAAVESASRCIAVGGDAPKLEGIGVEVIADPSAGCGPALAAQHGAQTFGLGTAPPDVVVVLSCDLPFIDQVAVSTLVTAQRATDADVVVPLRAGRPQWLVSAWRQAVLASAQAEPSASMRSLIAGLSIRYVVDSHLRRCCADTDSPEDLRSAQQVQNLRDGVQSG